MKELFNNLLQGFIVKEDFFLDIKSFRTWKIAIYNSPWNIFVMKL